MKSFQLLESDFYHFMINEGGLMPKTARDYLYRLRFLSLSHQLDSSITPESIEKIIEKETTNRLNRDIYNSTKAIADFRSCLRKFLAFINSDYRNNLNFLDEKEVDQIQSSSSLLKTEKEALLKSRIGQGAFRNNLIEYWGGCSITHCSQVNILVASHIKPWRVSTNKERLDKYNGLLLLPNLDKLFDLGYISFDNNGQIIISSLLSDEDKVILGLNPKLHLSRLEKSHYEYLEYHREKCFIK